MAEPTLSMELPGHWSSAWIFVRLLTLEGNPWAPTEGGFLEHEGTGERARLEMYAPAPGLRQAFEEGICPIRPTLPEPLLDEISEHHAVIRLSVRGSGPGPALTLLRAAFGVVNAGALAVRCGTSGLAHGADVVGPLLERAEVAPEEERAAALFESYVLVRSRPDGSARGQRTLGMHALGAPDVVLAHPLPPDQAAVRLEDAALALLRGQGPRETYPDPLTRADPRHNPHGLVAVQVGTAP